MGKSTIVESTVTKKSVELFNDEVDVDSTNYDDTTPVIIPLGKLRQILHEHVDIVFHSSTYAEFIEGFKD